MTWTVAEGRKGRRWREVVTRDRVIRSSLLYETGPDGRFAHLELATPNGLLTLHPEADGTLHGNAVTASGVRHVVGFPFASQGVVVVDGSVVALAAAAFDLGRRSAADGTDVEAVTVRSDLSLAAERLPIRAFSGAADTDGAPILATGDSWPLELDG